MSGIWYPSGNTEKTMVILIEMYCLSGGNLCMRTQCMHIHTHTHTLIHCSHRVNGHYIIKSQTSYDMLQFLQTKCTNTTITQSLHFEPPYRRQCTGILSSSCQCFNQHSYLVWLTWQCHVPIT